MKLSINGIKEQEAWKKAGIALPGYDVEAASENAKENPVWVHFGIGNIFRVFIGGIADGLLEEGVLDRGITCVETFDYDVADKIYDPYDNLGLSVILHGDGTREYKVLGSLAEAVKAQSSDLAQWNRLKEIFTDPGLQMISFTITEKGYALKNAEGNYFPFVQADIDNGPEKPGAAMAVVCALLFERFKAGKHPLAVVSMDNCSHNGEKLQNSILTMAKEWEKKGFVGADFVAYLSDEKQISFPWSMIDKITPRPNKDIADKLEALGIENMQPIARQHGAAVAPFVNAESCQYLVIEDRFPNGRPPMEKSGWIFTDRETVNKTERMKVCTCLNPLHTALAVFGCLLDYELISEEMKNPVLKKLVERIGYVEGLPVVTDPGILSPKQFIDEVLNIRIPNPFMPDTPQRIATDTSQKLSIRFGETIKSYLASPELSLSDLQAIPAVFAGWLRYLMGVDDNGDAFDLSPDPLLATVRPYVQDLKLGAPADREALSKTLAPLLSDASIFGVDLIFAGLSDRVLDAFVSMLQGTGAVADTLAALTAQF